MSQERILNELKEDAKELIGKIRRNAQNGKHVACAVTHLEDVVFRLEAARKQAEQAPAKVPSNGHAGTPPSGAETGRRVAIHLPERNDTPVQSPPPPAALVAKPAQMPARTTPPPPVAAPAKSPGRPPYPTSPPRAAAPKQPVVSFDDDEQDEDDDDDQELAPPPAPKQAKISSPGNGKKTRAGITAIEEDDLAGGGEGSSTDLSDLP